jgi:hypothetical protein
MNAGSGVCGESSDETPVERIADVGDGRTSNLGRVTKTSRGVRSCSNNSVALCAARRGAWRITRRGGRLRGATSDP